MTLGFLNGNREMLGASLLDCMQSKHCFICTTFKSILNLYFLSKLEILSL